MTQPGGSSRVRNNALLGLALTTVVIHLLCANGYGYFRDELYAIACSKHLAWGYVDQPPFSEFVLALIGHVLGYTEWALRLLPAACGGLVTLLVGLIARELGGGRFAQTLAATAYMAGGVYLAVTGYYSMNCFDHLFWALDIYLLVRILKGGDTRLWVLFGLVAGLGLENKYSMGFFGLGLVLGLALTPARRHLFDKWLWVGGVVAVLLFLPHVLWEMRHHFPTAEFIRNATLKKNLPMSPWSFLLECVLLVHPFTLPVWLAGLIYLFRGSKAGIPFRTGEVRKGGSGAPTPHANPQVCYDFHTLGWIYLAVLAVLLSTNSKPYYSAPAFLILLPAGGVAIDALLSRVSWKWPKPVCVSTLALGGAMLAPLALPVLPVETLIKYQSGIGITVKTEERGGESLKIPQVLADRFGWPELTAQVAQVYDQLTPEEKRNCVIGASNYGEAGAIDLFGKKYGLPAAISTHNNYWFWGPGDKPGQILLVVGGSLKNYEELYGDVRQIASVPQSYGPESGTPIFLCRKPKRSLREYWPEHHDFI